ncbi:MAG TPA: hypothetical protein VJ831_10345, partial [Jatrophihabitantaceae bacterium]|nr:hypothetical protein [Jatrophihabitantaceae bacterium]
MSALRVISFGTYDLTKHPRVGIVADGLREHGDDVVVVNAPLGFSTAERVELLRKPWTAFAFVARLLRRWATLVRRTTSARRSGAVDVVLVGYLGQFDVLLARLLFPRTTIVLDQMIFAADTARDRGITGGLKLALLDRLDRLAVRTADLVLLDTDEHLELMPAKRADRAVVVLVGAPDAWFARDEPSTSDDRPMRVVFFGLYTPLQGATTIGAALARLADRADITVTMIGRGQDLEATRRAAAANPHVTWLDWVDSDELPALVAGHDVCLGIFGTTPKASRVVPNKVYQGAAAG